MSPKSYLLTALVILLSFTTNLHADYIIEHQQLPEIIGQHTLTDFTRTFGSIQANLPLITFNEPLDLTDVDRMTITIIGTISPVTVCGSGLARNNECYTLNAGIVPGWLSPITSYYGGGIYDPSGVFSDGDPSFHTQWSGDLHRLIYPVPIAPPTIPAVPDNIICDGVGNCYRYLDDIIIWTPVYHPISLELPNPIESLQFVVGPLTDEIGDIPHYWGCNLFGQCIIDPAEGLEVFGSIELTITDAYITRKWNIPEPASLAILASASIIFTRRR